MAELWRMIGYGAKYGHQQLETLYNMTSDELVAFNEAVFFWIEKENKSGRSHE